jgi:hypothetical protein
MKITLTSEELLAILSKLLGATVTEFEIEQVVPTIVKTLDMFISQFPDYQIGQKIEATRALRQLSVTEKWYSGVMMGPADAKEAIERWTEFREFVLKHKRVPAPDFYMSFRNKRVPAPDFYMSFRNLM